MYKIMKFGGTSVNTEENRKCVINKIKKTLELGYKVVAIISAMGRKDEPYSTNTLRSFSAYLDGRQKDRLLAQGEILSSLVFENECRKYDILAHACTPSEIGIITDDHYQSAKVIHINPMWLNHHLKEVDVLIVPGFIGLSLSGHLTTLGKGGSDKTAILIADALDEKQVMIYTDVDGIYDLDPKLHLCAKKYNHLSYDECLSLVNQGACVMMKESVELAAKKGISFTVSSTFKDCDGTKVSGKKGKP